MTLVRLGDDTIRSINKSWRCNIASVEMSDPNWAPHVYSAVSPTSKYIRNWGSGVCHLWVIGAYWYQLEMQILELCTYDAHLGSWNLVQNSVFHTLNCAFLVMCLTNQLSHYLICKLHLLRNHYASCGPQIMKIYRTVKDIIRLWSMEVIYCCHVAA